jgi:hypothetical protein
VQTTRTASWRNRISKHKPGKLDSLPGSLCC